MKKTYISPAMDVTLIVAEQVIAGSITEVGGDAGITMPEDPSEPIPTEADVKGNSYNVWDVEW